MRVLYPYLITRPDLFKGVLSIGVENDLQVATIKTIKGWNLKSETKQETNVYCVAVFLFLFKYYISMVLTFLGIDW